MVRLLALSLVGGTDSGTVQCDSHSSGPRCLASSLIAVPFPFAPSAAEPPGSHGYSGGCSRKHLRSLGSLDLNISW